MFYSCENRLSRRFAGCFVISSESLPQPVRPVQLCKPVKLTSVSHFLFSLHLIWITFWRCLHKSLSEDKSIPILHCLYAGHHRRWISVSWFMHSWHFQRSLVNVACDVIKITNNWPLTSGYNGYIGLLMRKVKGKIKAFIEAIIWTMLQVKGENFPKACSFSENLLICIY